MTKLPFTFHHLGLAARRQDSARRFAEALGYQVGKTVLDPLQNVELAMCTHTRMPALEIVTPAATPGPLGQLLRSSTELVYHLCYEVPHLDTALEAIRGTIGTPRCVSEPKPAVLFDGRRVAFYLMSGCGLVELLEAA
jgi:methylmalonyl-CoA/ethylmalonyl-CoA epimerase